MSDNNQQDLSTDDKKKEDWMNSKWRPAMGWQYMLVCTFDFIVAPILWTIVQFWETQAANDAFRQWQPLTLQGAGLYHMAMGAVLGIAAWSRGQEKMAGAAATATTVVATTPSVPTPSVPSVATPPAVPAVTMPKIAVPPIVKPAE